jgi:hypothetical protein
MHTADASLRAGSEAVEAALLGSVPPPADPAIVHGDFRLGNALCMGGSVNVVIDWEIWSVGDPRVDLGWLVSGGPVLLLDVLPQDGEGAPPADPAKQDPDHSRFARQ